MHNSVPPDSDLEMRGGGGWSSRPLDKGGVVSQKIVFDPSALSLVQK